MIMKNHNLSQKTRFFLLLTSIHILLYDNEESHLVPEDQIFSLVTSIHILLYDNGESQLDSKE